MPRQNSNISQIQDMLLASFGRNCSIFQQLVSCAQSFYSLSLRIQSALDRSLDVVRDGFGPLCLSPPHMGALSPTLEREWKRSKQPRGSWNEMAYIATVRLKIEHP